MMNPLAFPMYIDVDTGIDDSLALAYLLRAGAEVAGVGTVSGNVDAATAARNTVDLLALLDHDEIPVAIGAQHPLGGRFQGGATHVHGANGIGNTLLPRSNSVVSGESAAELLIRLADEADGSLQIVALGPLTNLALALQTRPDLPSKIRAVTVMGGAARVPGNVTPHAEANIFADPVAAAAVFAADWSLTLVPLDVTMSHTLDIADRAQLLSSDDAAAEVLGEMLGFYMSFHLSAFGRRVCAYHDAIAGAIAVGRVVTARQPAATIHVDVSDGARRGTTHVTFIDDPKVHAHSVVLSLDGDPRRELMETLVPEHAWTDAR